MPLTECGDPFPKVHEQPHVAAVTNGQVRLEPEVGFEPTTNYLQSSRSTKLSYSGITKP